MTSNVTPFPIGKRVTSENIGIGGGLYYTLESIAKRIRYLLYVAEQQNFPEPGKTYRIVRRRTAKRCFLAIAQKGKKVQDKIHLLRKEGGYETAVNIFIELLTQKKGVKPDISEQLRDNLLERSLNKKDFEILVELLTGFHLTQSKIIMVIGGYLEIKGYNDDTYKLLKQIQQLPIQK